VIDSDGTLLETMLPLPQIGGERSLQEVAQHAIDFKTRRGDTPYDRAAEEQGNGILMMGANSGGTNPHVRFGADCVYAPNCANTLEERVYQEEFEMNALGPLVKLMHDANSRVPAVSATQERFLRMLSVVPKFDPHLLVRTVALSKNYSSGFHVDLKSADQAYESIFWLPGEGYDGKRIFASMHKDMDDNLVCIMRDLQDHHVCIQGIVAHCTTSEKHNGNILGFASVVMPARWKKVGSKHTAYWSRTMDYLEQGGHADRRPEFA
jgi:hypothetical protein